MACRIQTGGPPTYRLAGPISTASTLSPEEQTRAEVLFEAFCSANSLKNITSVFQKFCECLKLRPNDYRTFYTRLKERMGFSWKWKSLQSKLDKRFTQKEYNQGDCCSHTKVLVVGAGPCGLRAAIEAALLGAKVVVLEKRDRFSRNNVLHLWPFVISDLRSLGAKKLYPKFCGGSVDHISIRVLQCILLKVTLLLGVEVQYGVSFTHVVEPPEDQAKERFGWRAAVQPADHHVSSYEFDVLVGADGRRNTLQGFQRKVFRGMLAIAITANFINRNTPQEQNVPELSGVARIYNQQFFRDLHDTTGIDLENIVYYRDETHYFVMTAKKTSLINKGVLLNDYTEAERLLDRSNIDREALAQYAQEAAQFSTNNRLPNLEFAISQHGDPDAHVFDFTNMYAAENASRIVERRGHRLLVCLVGDSLVEPFWPLGTGCAHGFLGVLDAAWMIRQWALGYQTPLQLLTEREAIYRPLTSISPEHLHKNFLNYSIDPLSRYLHVDMTRTSVRFVRHLLDTDAPENVDKSELVMTKRNHASGFTPKRARKESISQDTLLEWCRLNLDPDDIHLDNLHDFWRNYRPLCALIHRFRPELIDYKNMEVSDEDKNWLLVLKIVEEQLGMALGFSPSDSVRAKENLSDELIIPVIAQLYELFKREIPGKFVPQLSMDSPSFDALITGSKRRSTNASEKSSRLTSPSPSQMSKRTMTVKENGKEPSKRRKGYYRESLHGVQKRRESLEPIQINMGEKIKFLEAAFNPERVEKSLADTQRKANPLSTGALQQMEAKLKNGATIQSEFDYKLRKLDGKLHDGTAGLAGGITKAKVDEYSSGLRETPQKSRANSQEGQNNNVNLVPVWTPEQAIRNDQTCYFCEKRVYPAERKSAENLFFHRMCFKCHHCNKILQINGDYSFDRYDPNGGKFYCLNHFKNRKHDFTHLTSPAKESASKTSDRSPVVTLDDPDGFTFARFPSLSNISSPLPASPRHVNDDSDEDDDQDAEVLDEEQVTLHNFGDAIRLSMKADDALQADIDTSEDEAWVSIDRVEEDVEDWKKKYSEKRNTSTTSNDSGSTSGESGGLTRKDKSVDSDERPSVPIRNAYEDSTSPGSTSDHECDSEVQAVISPSSFGSSNAMSVGPRAMKPTVITVNTGPVEVKVQRLNDQHHRLTVLSPHSPSEGSPNNEMTYHTPPTSVLLDHRPKSREIKWDNNLVETAKRLRCLRMSSGSETSERRDVKTPSDEKDEVFFTPKTSLPASRSAFPELTSTPKRLNFEEDEGVFLVPSAPPSQNDVRSRLEEQRAAARARAKLKSDEELGIHLTPRERGRSASASARKVVGSRSGLVSDSESDNENGRREVVRGRSSSERQAASNSTAVHIEQNVDDGRTIVVIGNGVVPNTDSDNQDSPSSSSPVRYFQKKTTEVAERFYKQEKTKLLHHAQEIQKLIDETELHLAELNQKVSGIEDGLRGDRNMEKSDKQLHEDWIAATEERSRTQLQLQELRILTEKIQLEDRHYRSHEQLRRLWAIPDDNKTELQKKQELELMDEVLAIRRLKEDVAVKLARYRTQADLAKGKATTVSVN